ncbi:P-loop NTPase fold protein [Lacticaseibacillus saniviri]|uniref:KAP NTPase domain-containing protein n=2 Tax=Lacticaseibacillus saniviri TaxID=931533 RepID=A0A0R2MTB5_9LACO|nr:P-loop NTPase fold protein [Lacticaseibacillus saniviri]KRO15520.1 hypothetical protein IV56_GL002288 [Lacticaseibacillus saniviri JCM 17471 = DSM 24301]MCG4281951.1 KAP family NTPase [Lacticaseibacillus saniviri]
MESADRESKVIQDNSLYINPDNVLGYEGNVQVPGIDTTYNGKLMQQQIQDKRTYFLNGPWGSGKTSLLNETRKAFQNKKFIMVNLWEETDNQTVLELIAKKLHPVLYRIGWIVALIVVGGYAWAAQYYVAKPKQNLFITWGVIGLLVAGTVLNRFQIKKDSLYFWLVKLRCGQENKILIFDDFDRVSPEQQKDAYKVFNNLKGKFPIVFVGDKNKIDLGNDTYMQKIIDVTLEMPYSMQPTSIWHEYYAVLGTVLPNWTPAAQNLETICIEEFRTLRDRERFNDEVNFVFFHNAKVGKVRTDTQLYIIYVFLFHPDVYQLLLSGFDFNKDNKKLSDLNPTLRQNFRKVLAQNGDMAPKPYHQDPQAYLIFEKSGSLSQLEYLNKLGKEIPIESIFEQSTLESRPYFQAYIVEGYVDLPSEIQTKLIKTVVELWPQENKYPGIYNLILRQSSIFEKNSQESARSWFNKLAETGLEVSKYGQFLLEGKIVKFETLYEYVMQAKLMPKNFDKKTIQAFEEPQVMILMFIAHWSQKGSPKKSITYWNEREWDVVKELDSKRYLELFEQDGLIDIGRPGFRADQRIEDIVTIRIIDMTKTAKNRIEPRLKQIAKEMNAEYIEAPDYEFS